MSENPVRVEQEKKAEAPTPRASRKPLIIAIIALLAIAVAALIIASTLNKPLTQAEAPQLPPGDNLATIPTDPPQPGPPVTGGVEPPAATPKPPDLKAPPEVVAYLAHLRRVDQYRIAMQQAQIGQSAELLKSIKPAQGEELDIFTYIERLQEAPTKHLSGLISTGQKLMRWFNAVRPPAECQNLHRDYYAALGGVVTAYSNLQQKLGDGDLATALQGRQVGKATSDAIDQYFENADDELQTILNKYSDLERFRIRPEAPAGSLLAPPGD